MKKLFPGMYNSPRPEQVIGIIISWVIVLVFIPFAMPVFLYQVMDNSGVVFWVEIGYVVFSGVVVTILMKDYLQDALLDLQVQPRKLGRHVAVTVALMLGAVLLGMAGLWLSGETPLEIICAFPMVHLSVLASPWFLLRYLPWVSVICLTVTGPILFCGMFYATGFAPVCCKRGWLGYVSVTLLILVTTLFQILWQGSGEYTMQIFLLRLPVHLIACWSYQKTDNIWTPILSLTVLNLLTGLADAFFI